MHYMRFKGVPRAGKVRDTCVLTIFTDSKGVKTLHQNFVDHCAKTYSTLSNWIIHLDVDE